MTTETKDFLLILFPIISGLASSYLTYYLTFKAKKNETILKFKQEKYANLLILLQGLAGNTASADNKREFFKEQYTSWLFSSDEVVSSINDMIDVIIREQNNEKVSKEYTNALGKIAFAMRRDMLKKTNLAPSDFRYFDVYEDNGRSS